MRKEMKPVLGIILQLGGLYSLYDAVLLKPYVKHTQLTYN